MSQDDPLWGSERIRGELLKLGITVSNRVLRFISHGRRELVHLAMTAHPAAAWVRSQLVEATPWGRRPTHLLRDRDAVYGGDVRGRAKARGIDTVLSPVRAPRAKAYALHCTSLALSWRKGDWRRRSGRPWALRGALSPGGAYRHAPLSL